MGGSVLLVEWLVQHNLVTFFHDLNNNVTRVDGTLKICISCRRYPIVGLTPSLEICVEKHNQDDILSYVNAKLQSIIESEPKSTESIGLHDLAKTIVNRASGVFQWVSLVTPMVIQYHSEGESLRIISERIKEVPDLDDVYKHIFQNIIDVRNQPRSLHLLEWICLAERPLSVTELRYAIASDDMYIDPSRISCHDSKDFIECDSRMIKLITTLSGGLAEAKQHFCSNAVQFIHQSVGDFLLSSGLRYLFPPHRDESLNGFSSGNILGNSQDRLSRSCINYLILSEVKLSARHRDDKRILFEDQFPLVHYATHSWFLYARKAESYGTLQTHLVETFRRTKEQAFENWIQISRLSDLRKDLDRWPESGSTLLHVASSLNLQSTVRSFLSAGKA
ncbi:hypothetical protein MMC14_008690 [Varicellaria rhodocarpa]|nr:hypothetical protein [Varicellaria rhodocarpa]